jgi:hypothetical protein
LPQPWGFKPVGSFSQSLVDNSVLPDDFRSRVHAVEWERLRRGVHDMRLPDDLLGLLSETPGTREYHRARLENSLLLQGTLTAAAYYAIPFFVEMTKWEEANETVYALLVIMTICSEPGGYDEGIELGGRSCSLKVACRAEIAKGIPYYLRDVCDQRLTTECRLNALSTVCRFPELRELWLPTVRAALERESIQEIRDQIAEWLADVN